jgi:hypothetical protein
MSRISALQISPADDGTPPTPAQKRFNSLLRQIEQARGTLAAWHESLASYREAHAKVLLPLEAELAAALRKWVFALEAVIPQRDWTGTQRATLRKLVCEGAEALLADRRDDAEVKALYDRNSDVDFDTQQRETAHALKDFAEHMSGLDLGDDEGLRNEADLFERMRQGFEQHAAAEEARGAERQARAARRPRSAAQQRREAEAQQATQSLREIYRKLASSLHPDREVDERERAAKTALMQRVNQAYSANDLLALLELQLQIEQIDATHIANAGAARLKHYNKVLAGQLEELKAEIVETEMRWRMEFGLEPWTGTDPRKLLDVIRHAEHAYRGDLARSQRDLAMLADVPATKRWLNRERERLRREELAWGPF